MLSVDEMLVQATGIVKRVSILPFDMFNRRTTTFLRAEMLNTFYQATPTDAS
jgi:hypothetical protein